MADGVATAYLTADDFKTRTLADSQTLESLESQYPGWVAQQLIDVSARINARLRKRYAAPFATPVPEIVLSWLTRIVTHRCYLKIGIRATDETYQDVKGDAEAAQSELKEAADSEKSLFDLPLRDDGDTSAVKVGILSRSNASPFSWMDDQVARFNRYGR